MPLTADEVLVLAGRFRLAQAITAAAQLGLADALADSPATAAELAERLSVDERALGLLLRALVGEGVFGLDRDRRYRLEEPARALLSSERGGHRELIVGWAGHPAVYRGLERLADGVRRGQPSFELVHGKPFFGWLADRPDELAAYLRAVGGEQPEEFTAFVEALDLSDARVVADVGGGGGGLLRAALSRWPHLRGMLIDLPSVVDTVAPVLRSSGADRISCHPADCTVAVPSGADVYVMTTVLRYFDDETALRTLRNIRDALADAAPPRRLALSEMPVGDDPSSPADLKSLVEFALSGGQDRTVRRLQELLEDTGFVRVTARQWEGPYWLVQAEL